jgi:outer membrane immunogenic protein
MVMARLGRIFSFAAVMLASAAMARPAAAADPAAATVNWTGFYVGGDIGALFTDAHYIQPATGLQEVSLGTIDGRPVYGTYGGFNYQVTPWAVIGLEGSFNWLSAAYYREVGFTFDFLHESRWVDTVAARAGLIVRPDTMVFAKIGPAWIDSQGISGIPGSPFQQTLTGIQGGVGIESLVTPNIALRAEASYTYATQELDLPLNASTYRLAFMTMQIGAAYKFDAPAGWGVPASLQSRPTSLFDPFFVDPFAPLAVFNAAPMVLKGPPGKTAPADPPDPRWTGFEFGGFVSANGNQVTYNDTLISPLGPFTDFTVGGGWFVGANYRIQRFVLGVEVDGNYENANFQTAAGSGGVVNFYHFANISRVLAVTGRAGWLMTPETLLYVKAGPADMIMTPDTKYWNAIAPQTATLPTTFAGYVAGFGAETFLLPRFSVRFEALYTHTDRTLVLQGGVPNEFLLQPSIISAMLGVAFHL